MRHKPGMLKWLVLPVFVLSACSPGKGFSVDAFDSSPADSDGVGCFFSDEAAPEKQLFASGLDNYAYIAINRSLCKLEQDTTTQVEASKNAADMLDVFRYEHYTVILDLKETGPTDGGSAYKGTMTVKNNKTGKKVVKKVSGSCGC
jgi:hypothetical protein